MRHREFGLGRRLDGHHRLVLEAADPSQVLVRDVGVPLVLVEQLQLQLGVLDEVVELPLLRLEVGEVGVQVSLENLCSNTWTFHKVLFSILRTFRPNRDLSKVSLFS